MLFASKLCCICLRPVAEVLCTAVFSRASPDNLAGRLSVLLQVLIEQARDVPVIIYHSCKNAALGPEKTLETFCAMGKANLDTCLSSSSPKLISNGCSKGTCGTEVPPYTAEVRLCNKRTVVGLSVGLS